MKALFYDAETTGLPEFSLPSDDPCQPHIVQLAAALVDLDTRAVEARMDVIVRPEGWDITPDNTAIHGISHTHAVEHGIPESDAVFQLVELWQQANKRIAHNESFDARILRIALFRHPHADPDLWKGGSAECTMKMASPIMKMAPTARMQEYGRSGNKPPKLTEAYRHFLGTDMANAHNAAADVEGCMAVYFAIRAPRAA